MVLHRAVRKRLFAPEKIGHEEIGHEDAAPVFREGRAIDRLVRAKIRHQRLGHRADVALCCGIDGRAVFPEEPLRPGAASPVLRGFRQPPWRQVSAVACSIGPAAAKAAGGPEAMIASLPAAALTDPPEIGASPITSCAATRTTAPILVFPEKRCGFQPRMFCM